ncbi:MarR family winged helix-turn-helix transcriptional regulator [Burkholderia cenocepacia]|uniref:MarR family winged helix-turn-helix transcriptional regulator n=1 Tax=Burkholderia cenocepacia TaxID=95486 RepID=UPI0023B91901|nr:MarR family winged helix-turn-helix transcriptional regulator [Burkholderia cenocepacia]MDF0504829.1 MarR family winged helix-turn-helix transcriptional regulator [Burkholderia cenocepacia]
MSITALHVASEVLQIFRRLTSDKLDKQDVPPNLVVVFAAIAANPGQSLKEIQASTGLGVAVVSRSCAMLGRGKPAVGVHGLGLISTEEDPTNFSRKIVSLTPAGEGLLREIDEQLGRFIRQRPGKA